MALERSEEIDLMGAELVLRRGVAKLTRAAKVLGEEAEHVGQYAVGDRWASDGISRDIRHRHLGDVKAALASVVEGIDAVLELDVERTLV